MVHARLGVGDASELVVLHRARKGDQGLDGVALRLNVPIEALLVAHRFQARSGHDHRLGPAADLVPRDRLEVLDHHLGLLRDIVRMQPHETRERPCSPLALYVGIVLAGLEQLEVRSIRGVVLQHVEDELLLDRLTHSVAVHWPPVAAEHGERLVLGGGGEGKEAQVRLLAALGHAAEERFQVFPAFLGRPFPGLFPKLLAAQHFLEIGSRLAALRAVRLVEDDGAPPGGERARTGRPAFLGHLEQLARDEWKFLKCGDDHRHRIFERLGELSRAFVDPLHDAERVFELIDRVLELLIEHDAIGDHDHAVEDARVGGIVQGREPMRQPADCVALAAARGMLDEVVVPHAVAARRVHQHAHRFELVVAGEDHGLRLDLAAPIVAFLVGLQVDEAGEEVEQAVTLQHLLPQVGRAVGPTLWIRRVPRGSLATLVEGQKVRRRARQTGGHEHRFGVHGKMHQRAALELEDRLAGVAALLVLPACILDPLASERVLQLQRRHRNAVQAQRDIE